MRNNNIYSQDVLLIEEMTLNYKTEHNKPSEEANVRMRHCTAQRFNLKNKKKNYETTTKLPNALSVFFGLVFVKRKKDTNENE